MGNFYDRMLVAVAVPGFSGTITGQVRDFLDFSGLEVFGLRYPYILTSPTCCWWPAWRCWSFTGGRTEGAETPEKQDAETPRRGDAETGKQRTAEPQGGLRPQPK